MLAGLLAGHRGPLAADFFSHYNGLRLKTIRSSGLTVEEVADFAANLPPDSAVARALNPEWFITPDTYLLRAIEYNGHVLWWQNTADGQSKSPKNHPVRIPLTYAEAEAAKPEREKYDASTIEEMDEFLGWSA